MDACQPTQSPRPPQFHPQNPTTQPTQQIFGGFTTTPWAINVNAHGPEYYGTGESFLWRRLNEGRDSNDRIQQEEDGREPPQPQLPQQQQRRRRASTAAARAMLGGVDVFPWSRENNLNMLSTERSLAMGGGGGEYGLYLGENFESGVSGACETFGNPPLAAKGKHFEVLDLEWCVELIGLWIVVAFGGWMIQ